MCKFILVISRYAVGQLVGALCEHNLAYNHPGTLTISQIPSERQQVPEIHIRNVIAQAGVINRDVSNTSMLLFLLEARTHYIASEYRRSFVVSWLVIESWLQAQWDTLLDGRDLSKTRKERLNRSDT